MAKGSCLKGKIVSFHGTFPASAEKLEQWIKSAGGEYKSSLADDTTHLVVSEERWNRQSAKIIEALKNKKLKILNYDWLHETLQAGRKMQEGSYEWKKIHKDAIKKRKQKERLEAKQQKNADKQSHNLTISALQDHTKEYRARNRSRSRQKKSVSASIATTEAELNFAKGAKAAKADIQSENHHIYRDDTGYEYQVRLVKTHLNTNTNHQIVLTIFESNEYPHRYTIHLKHSDTSLNNFPRIEGALGSNFPTAYRTFKNLFEDKTKVTWDKRFEVFTKRVRVPRAGDSTGENGGGFITPRSLIAAGGMRQHGGTKQMTAEQKKEFDAKPFRWRPPVEGEPTGALLLDESALGGWAIDYCESPTKQNAEGDMVHQEGDVHNDRQPQQRHIANQGAVQFIQQIDSDDDNNDSDSSEDSDTEMNDEAVQATNKKALIGSNSEIRNSDGTSFLPGIVEASIQKEPDLILPALAEDLRYEDQLSSMPGAYIEPITESTNVDEDVLSQIMDPNPLGDMSGIAGAKGPDAVVSNGTQEHTSSSMQDYTGQNGWAPPSGMFFNEETPDINSTPVSPSNGYNAGPGIWLQDGFSGPNLGAHHNNSPDHASATVQGSIQPVSGGGEWPPSGFSDESGLVPTPDYTDYPSLSGTEEVPLDVVGNSETWTNGLPNQTT